MFSSIITEKRINLAMFLIITIYVISAMYIDIMVFGGFTKLDAVGTALFHLYKPFDIGLHFAANILLFVCGIQLLKQNKNARIFIYGFILFTWATLLDAVKLQQLFYLIGSPRKFVDVIGFPSVLKIVIFLLITVFVQIKYKKPNTLF